MPSPSLPTSQQQLFRSLIYVGLLGALISAATFGTLAVISMRKIHMQDLLYHARTLGEVAATNITNPKELTTHLHDFSHDPGLQLSCIYNKNNILLAEWHAAYSNRSCPDLLSTTGIQQQQAYVKISHAINKNGIYYGMIYMESSLATLSFAMMRTMFAIIISMFAAGLACILVSKRLAARASQPVAALVNYVECLQRNDTGSCLLPDHETKETFHLRHTIASLRKTDAENTVSLSHVEKISHWYRGAFFGLLALLRRRLNEDSSLLPTINDYSLLLRLEEQTALSEPKRFDLFMLADRVLSTAKKMHPPGPDVYVTFSVKPNTVRYWVGQEELIEALLRNLLLASLARTHHGMVCLRLETKGEGTEPPQLVFTLEDSGEIIPEAQFERIIKENAVSSASFTKPYDLTWMMIARIPPLLAGGIQVQACGGSQLFTGTVIAGTPSVEETPLPLPTIAGHSLETSPFVLLVEDDRANRETQRLLFERAGCRVLAVATAEQALEWAAALPFSAMAVDTVLPGMQGPEFALQVRRKMQDSTMRGMPIWALTSANTSQDREAWTRAGAETILVKPITMERVLSLSAQLFFCDTSSFLAHSNDIEDGLSINMSKRLPALRKELAQQIALLLKVFSEENDQVMADAAHAVKSAALTLGYHRLSVCMDALEHIARMGGTQVIGKENFVSLEQMLTGVIDILHPPSA